MIKIDIRTDAAKAINRLEGIRRDQIPFATAYALTKIAQAAQAALEIDTRRAFDRPTRFTQKAFRITPATKTRLFSSVSVKDEATGAGPAGGSRNRTALAWMSTQTYGGPRPRKGFENALERAKVLPPGWYAIPTQWAPKDAYGNVPASKLNQILSQIRARRDSSQNETPELSARRNSLFTKTGRRKKQATRPSRYFSAQLGGKLKPGIYERVGFAFGSSVRPVFIFTQRQPRYAARFPFQYIVERTYRKTLDFYYKEGFRRAMATARPAA
jgi:hypothetical protein